MRSVAGLGYSGGLRSIARQRCSERHDIQTRTEVEVFAKAMSGVRRKEAEFQSCQKVHEAQEKVPGC